jgi:16S rRNA (guanine966-N2)-methyltransferase
VRIIAGEWGGRRIEAPRGGGTRPTTDRVREAWMSAIQHHIPDASVLDLFAGSGALGIETLSRGAEHATFVEGAPAALRALAANLASLGADQRSRIVRGDALRFASTLTAGAFDIALADPPYGGEAAATLAEYWIDVPFAATLCIEHGRHDRLPEVAGSRSRRYGDTVITIFEAPS